MQPDAMAPKKNVAVMAAAAAIVVALLAVGGYFMFRDKTPEITDSPLTTAGTDVTTTAIAPVPAGQGVLLLSASPWGDLDRIVRKSNQKEIAISDDLRSTPARIPLEPGSYLVTLSGPGGQQTIDVQIEAGKPTTQHLKLGSVDYEQLAEEVAKP
jgi:hypothetical protein